MSKHNNPGNVLRALTLAFVPALFLVTTSAAADETDYDSTAFGAVRGAAAGAATGGPAGAAVGAIAGAVSGYIADLKEGIADNERKYNEGTAAREKDQQDSQ